MKYTKKLLAREDRDYSDEFFYGSVFEMLNNEKTLEEYTTKVLSRLNKIKGNIYVVRRNQQTIDVLNESEDFNKESILESEVYQKVRETKKPFMLHNWEPESGEYFAGYPLNLKGRFVGALIIEEKQEIKYWKEIFVALHMLVFGFRYFALIEKERNMNIKDVVTGLYNDKYFFIQLEAEHAKYVRFKTPMTLVLIELENFSSITNEYDYEVGEKVLQIIGSVIQRQSRIYDMPARVERGLFAVLLSSTEELGGEAISNRVIDWVGDAVEVNEKEIPVTLKFAYSEYQNHHTRESFFKEVYDKLTKK
jgi:diguanylate cyclase (GGDEF)-like protein